MIETFAKNPIIEGSESLKFKVKSGVVAYINQYGVVGSVCNADLAEAFEYEPNIVKELPEEGTVMVLNKNGKVVPSFNIDGRGEDYIGIIKYSPGIFLGGTGDWEGQFKEAKTVPIALIGQVKVLVDSKFTYKPNTKLVPYINGTARPLIYKDDEYFGKVLKVISDNEVLAIIR